MKFFKKKEPRLQDLVVHSPLRDFLLDSQVEPVTSYMTALGLPPMSQEVVEMERRTSDRRVQRLVPLIPLLHDYAHALVLGSIAVQKEYMGEEAKDVPEEVWDRGHQTIESAAMALVIGAISQLVEVGALEVMLED